MGRPYIPPAYDDFIAWIREHPDGRLLNQPERGKFTMHKTRCFYLEENDSDKPSWTRREKACAEGPSAVQDLEFWAWTHHQAKPWICTKCEPKG